MTYYDETVAFDHRHASQRLSQSSLNHHHAPHSTRSRTSHGGGLLHLVGAGQLVVGQRDAHVAEPASTTQHSRSN
jgi:hypothetical protein